ncbi:MAG: hypothetical protein V3U03_17420 [Myxococcota bacterium]
MTTSCSACGAALLWAKSPNDADLPLDEKAACYRIEEGRAVRVFGIHVSHFATCSEPERFSSSSPRELPAPPSLADAKRLGLRLGAQASIVITFAGGTISGSSWGESSGSINEAAKQLRTILAGLQASPS